MNFVALQANEPLSNLDAKLRTSMRTEIIKLHNKAIRERLEAKLA